MKKSKRTAAGLFSRRRWPESRGRFFFSRSTRTSQLEIGDVPKLLSIQETAQLLRVHPNTLREWDRLGKLRAVRLGARRDRRYDRDRVWPLYQAIADSQGRRLRLPIVEQLQRYQQHWQRGAVAAGLALVVVTLVSLSGGAVAKSAKSVTSSIRPTACVGWQEAAGASQPDGPGATISRADVAVQGQVNADQLNAINPTLVCRSWPLASRDRGLEKPQLAIKGDFQLTVDDRSADVYVAEWSIDDDHWQVIQVFSSRDPGRGSFSVALPTLSLDQLPKLQFRLRYEAEPLGTGSAALVRNLRLELKGVSPSATDEKKVPAEKKKLNRLVEFSQAAYSPDESPEVVVPRRREKRALFWRIGTEEWRVEHVALVDAEGREIELEPAIKEVTRRTEADQRLTFDMRRQHPGAYRAKVRVRTPAGTIETIERKFLWGVAALNITRAAAHPGETQVIAMGVLDDSGKTICQADITVTVKGPNGRAQKFTTADGTVKTSGVCVDKGVTNKPDYAVEYQIGKAGLYHIRMVAKTDFGERIVEENFQVDPGLPFAVNRFDYPTRIYPPAAYPVRIAITPQRDFIGPIHESVPSNFKVSSLFPEGRVGADPERPDRQQLEWLVDWKKGETYYLAYTFDAPDISPALFLTGELSIGGSFSEAPLYREGRQWQIASDSVNNALEKFTPTSENLVTVGSALTLTGSNLKSYRGALANDSAYFAWNGSSSGFDVQVNFDNVALSGANKILLTTETANITSARSFYIQICDWVTSTGVDNAADSQCTTGGWRTLNNPKGTAFTETSDTTRVFEIFNGYFYSGSAPGTAVNTPLANFINGTQFKLRFYSTANDTATMRVDRAQLEVAIDPVYFPDSITGQNSYTVSVSSGDYGYAFTSDNNRLVLNNNNTNPMDTYYAFKNVQTYTGANTVLVNFEGAFVSATAMTYNVAIRNFNSSSWEDLHSGQITASGTSTDQQNYFAKSNVTLSNYISSNEIRIRVYSTVTGTQTFGLDRLYITVGSVNTDTGVSEISFGKADAGATTSTNTQTIDALTTSSSTSDWKQTYCKNNSDSGCATKPYTLDWGGTYNTHFSASANLSFPLTPPANGRVTGVRYAARFMSNSASVTALLGVRDYGSSWASSNLQGGWVNLSTANAYTAANCSAAATTYTFCDGTYSINSDNLVDTVNNLGNLRLRTSGSSATSAPSDRHWDFAFMSLRWINGLPAKNSIHVPSADNLTTGTWDANSSTNVGSYKGAFRGDSVFASITSAAASPSLDYQLTFNRVNLLGANKLIFNFTQRSAASTRPLFVQICDWVSSTGVDNAADANCTTGGWRTLTNPKGTGLTDTVIFTRTFDIFDGYFYTGSAPGTRVSTPLSNFLSGDSVKIRFYSNTNAAVRFDLDFVQLTVAIDPVYYPSAVTANGNYSLSVSSGDYGYLAPDTGTSRLELNNNATNPLDVYFTFDNIRSYPGANTIGVFNNASYSATTMTFNMAIYNFSSAAWEDLHSGQITPGGTANDFYDIFAKNNVNLRDYVSYSASSPYYGQSRIRVYSTAQNTDVIKFNQIYIVVGSTNTDSSKSEISFGKLNAGDVTKTRDVDITQIDDTLDFGGSSSSTWKFDPCLNGTDTGCSSTWYHGDFSASLNYNTYYAAGANFSVPITVPANANVTAVLDMTVMAAGDPSGATVMVDAFKDYGGHSWPNPNSLATGGWLTGSQQSGADTFSYSLSTVNTNAMNLIDMTNGLGNLRLRTDTVTDPTGGWVTAWDFGLETIRYVLVGPTISISGNVYSDDATSVLSNCNGARSLVAIRTGGQTVGTVSCHTSTGFFQLDNIPQPATGDPIYIWISGVTNVYATSAVRYSGSGNVSSVKVRQNRLVLKNDDASSLTNSDLNGWQNSNDSDLVYSVSSGNLTTEASTKLVVDVGTFAPGGTVTTAVSSSGTDTVIEGDVSIASGATLSMGTNALSIGGDLANAGTFSVGTQTTTFTATASGFDITMGASSFSSVNFSGASGTWTPTDSNVTASGNVTVGTNATLSVASSKTFTQSGGSSSLSLSGTISGAGTYIYQSSNTFPAGGTISSILRMDSTSTNQSLGARTYGGVVVPYNNGSTNRTLTLGTAGSQALVFSSNLNPNANSSGDIFVQGGTYNPTVTLTGNLDFTGTGNGTEIIAFGDGTWTVSGDIDLTGGAAGPQIATLTPTWDDTAHWNRTVPFLCGGPINSYSCTGGATNQFGHLWNGLTCDVDGEESHNYYHLATQYDISGINNSATILQAQFHPNVTIAHSPVDFYNSTVDNLSAENCNSETGTFSKIGNTAYLSNSTALSTTGVKRVDLGATAASDIQTRLTTSDTFSFFAIDDGTYDPVGEVSANAPLSVGYVVNTTSTIIMNGSGKFLTTAGNHLYNLTLSGTITLTNGDTAYIDGNLDLTGSTLTTTGHTLVMSRAGKTITAAGKSLNHLTIDPSTAGTVTLNNGGDDHDLTVVGTLAVASGDTLSIASSAKLLHSGSTLTLTGTISGAGTLIYRSATAFPTSGTMSAALVMDATSTNQTLGARTYGGAVTLNSDYDLGTRTWTWANGTFSMASLTTVCAGCELGGAISIAASLASVVTVTGSVTSGQAFGAVQSWNISGATWTVGGTFDLTHVTSLTAPVTLVMNGTGNLIGNAKTLNSLTVNGDGNTVTVTGSDVTVANTLTLGGTNDNNNDTLTIASGRTVTLSGTSGTTFATCSTGCNTDTVNGPGRLTYRSSTAFPTSATFATSLIVRYDLASNNMTTAVRTDYGKIEAFSSSGSARTLTLGNGPHSLSAGFEMQTTGAGTLLVDGDASDPAITVTGDVTAPAASGAITLSMGSGTWTVGGAFNLTNVSTLNHNSGTLTMSGTGTLTSNGKTLNHVTTSGSGTITLANASHGIAGNLTLGSSSTLTMGSSTPTVSGNVTLAGTVNANTSTLTMDGGATKNLDGGGKTLNNLTISGTVATATNAVTVGSTLSVTGTLSGSQNVTVHGTASGSGTITLSGGTFEQRVAAAQNFGSTSGSNNWTFNHLTFSNSSASDRTVTLASGGTGQIITNGTLTIGNGSDTNVTTIENETNDRIIDANGPVSITAKGSLAASSSASFTVGGHWTLTSGGVLTAGSGTVTFDGLGQQDIGGTGTMTGANKFNALAITNSSGDGSSTWSVTFAGDTQTGSTLTVGTANTKLRFNAGSTYTFQNISLNGQATGTRVFLRSSSAGTQWHLNVAGTRGVSYTDVQDSNACGQAPNIDATDGTNLDQGNNSCWTIAAISFSVSANSLSFGSFSAASSRYANTSSGSASDTVAHTISASSNGGSGYVLTVQGSTLTAGAHTITPITTAGGLAASNGSTEQFGLYLTASGGSGVVDGDYDDSATPAFYFGATGSTADPIASKSGGSTAATTYSLHYLMSAAADTEPGAYSCTVSYVLTSTF